MSKTVLPTPSLPFNDNLKNAVFNFTKAIELDINYGIAYIGRAQVYAIIGQYEKAKIDTLKYIALLGGWNKLEYRYLWHRTAVVIGYETCNLLGDTKTALKFVEKQIELMESQ